MKKSKIILSIESAIRSGSVSILENGKEIDFWVGTKTISRAEDLLEVITLLLSQNELAKEDIDVIAVSNFVGSYTGVRIGLSTALGIKKGLMCKVVDESILRAIACAQTVTGKIITAVSNNNREVLSQTFESGSANNLSAIIEVENRDIEKFCRFIKDSAPISLYVNHDLFEVLYELKSREGFQLVNINNAGKNLAKYIGKISEQKIASDNDF